MFALLNCKKLQLLSPSFRNVGDSPTYLQCLQFTPLTISRLFSLSKKKTKEAGHGRTLEKHSFTVSYLINSCGLSPETANTLSKKVQFETPEQPDSVLDLLRNYGFTITHISKLVKALPEVLLANVEKTLLPKLEFYRSIGLSDYDIAKIFSADPSVFWRSLEQRLIPSYNFLKSVLVHDDKVFKALKPSSWICHLDVGKSVAPNVSVLREIGVPESVIAMVLTHNSGLVCRDPDKFNESVKKVIDMGFNPSKQSFIRALIAMSQVSESTWSRKMEVYRRWGWSDDDIWSAFKKQPICMTISEKKVMGSMDVFVNKMGWKSLDIVNCPDLLLYSLKRRTIPRCSIIKILLSKGLLEGKVSQYTLLRVPNRCFLDKIVTKYQGHVPQLADIFSGNVGSQELGFGSEDK